MEFTTLLGIAIGVGGILVGNALEDGHFASLIQLTAGFIVFGGTFGATIVANTMDDLRLGLALMLDTFRKEEDSKKQIAEEIVICAQLVRKESLLALEKRLKGFPDAYMKNVFRFMVDGVEVETLRDMFEHERHVYERRQLVGAKVWSDAGGYAPTIGIIGAVLGLIHVMSNLSDTSALGKGIAVAFVATIYGVASANLIFLPIASKVKRKIKQRVEVKEMILEGAVSIAGGLSPFVVQEKMRAYLDSDYDKI